MNNRKKKSVLIACLLLGAFFLVRWSGSPNCDTIRNAVLSWGKLAPVGFVLLYVLATILFVPGTLPTLAAGMIFGTMWGTFLVSVGSMLGAMASFLIARYLARDTIETILEKQLWFQKFKTGFQSHSTSYLLFLRLSPIFPFNGLNYASGLLPVSFTRYALTSFFGMLPGTLAYVYAGEILGCAAISQNKWSRHLETEVFLGLLALSVLSLVPLLWRRTKGKKG